MATSPLAAIHWQLWCAPAPGRGWPRSSARSHRACKQTCSAPGWDSSRGEKESLAKIKYNILQYLQHPQQCRSGPLAHHSMASGGLVLFAAAQVAKVRPCLSENMLGRTWRHRAGRDAGGSNSRKGAWPCYKETGTSPSNEQQKETQLTTSPDAPNSYSPQLGLTTPAIPSASTALSGTGTVLRTASCTRSGVEHANALITHSSTTETGTTKTQRKLQLKMKS